MSDRIKVLFPHEEFEEVSYESAWAKRNGNNFQLDNILFYGKEYSYGDVFSVKKTGEKYFVDELIEESGHSTIRILFSDLSLVDKTRNELKELRCDSELSNLKNLISVNIPPSIDYKNKIKTLLDSGENAGLWEYQEACISNFHSGLNQ
jgi:hypothetical protein